MRLKCKLEIVAKVRIVVPGEARAYARPEKPVGRQPMMRQLTSVLAALMLLLTAWSGTAHAAELVTCNEPIAVEMVMHIAGDCDQVPGDRDKAYPHHHDGCNGQHVSTAALDTVIAERISAEQTYGASPIHAIVATDVDRTLRPPRA